MIGLSVNFSQSLPCIIYQYIIYLSSIKTSRGPVGTLIPFVRPFVCSFVCLFDGFPDGGDADADADDDDETQWWPLQESATDDEYSTSVNANRHQHQTPS